MTTKTERLAEVEALRTATIDTAQQRFRADTADALAAYIEATAGPRAELEAREELAARAYAEAVNTINAEP